MYYLLALFLTFSFLPTSEECKITVPDAVQICTKNTEDVIVFNYQADCKIYYSKLMILNRWGQPLFTEENKKGKGWKGWNGKIGDRFAAHAETLVYQIEYKVAKKSKLQKIQGNFTVLHQCE